MSNDEYYFNLIMSSSNFNLKYFSSLKNVKNALTNKKFIRMIISHNSNLASTYWKYFWWIGSEDKRYMAIGRPEFEILNENKLFKIRNLYNNNLVWIIEKI